jgi:hypothetical protein
MVLTRVVAQPNEADAERPGNLWPTEPLRTNLDRTDVAHYRSLFG